MTTGASDSLGKEQSIDLQPQAAVSSRAISKQKVIIGVALLLAVLGLVIFRLTAHANGQDIGASSNSTSTEAAASPSSDPAANEPLPTTPATDGASDNGNSSVSVQLNSTTTTSSNPAGNSSSSQLSVNGQNIPVKGNNIVKHYTNSDGSTSVSISSHTSSTSEGDSQ